MKLVKGTLQKCRTNRNEPKVEAGIPDMPSHLDAYAREEWARIVPLLAAMGVLTKADRTALAVYCQAFARWRQAEESLARSGLLIKTVAGNVIQNPLVGTAHKCMELTHRFAVEFGLTPSARTRVAGFKQGNGASDPWQDV